VRRPTGIAITPLLAGLVSSAAVCACDDPGDEASTLCPAFFDRTRTTRRPCSSMWSSPLATPKVRAGSKTDGDPAGGIRGGRHAKPSPTIPGLAGVPATPLSGDGGGDCMFEARLRQAGSAATRTPGLNGPCKGRGFSCSCCTDMWRLPDDRLPDDSVDGEFGLPIGTTASTLLCPRPVWRNVILTERASSGSARIDGELTLPQLWFVSTQGGEA